MTVYVGVLIHRMVTYQDDKISESLNPIPEDFAPVQFNNLSMDMVFLIKHNAKKFVYDDETKQYI